MTWMPLIFSAMVALTRARRMRTARKDERMPSRIRLVKIRSGGITRKVISASGQFSSSSAIAIPTRVTESIEVGLSDGVVDRLLDDDRAGQLQQRESRQQQQGGEDTPGIWTNVAGQPPNQASVIRLAEDRLFVHASPLPRVLRAPAPVR